MERGGKIKRGRYVGKDFAGRKIYFASQENICEIYEEALDFIKKIFSTDAIFLSDESSLRDFTDPKDISIEKVVKKVKRIYGVDVSSIKDKPLFKIVSFIMDMGN